MYRSNHAPQLSFRCVYALEVSVAWSSYLLALLFWFILIKEFSLGVWNLATSKHTKTIEKETHVTICNSITFLYNFTFSFLTCIPLFTMTGVCWTPSEHPNLSSKEGTSHYLPTLPTATVTAEVGLLDCGSQACSMTQNFVSTTAAVPNETVFAFAST